MGRICWLMGALWCFRLELDRGGNDRGEGGVFDIRWNVGSMRNRKGHLNKLKANENIHKIWPNTCKTEYQS